MPVREKRFTLSRTARYFLSEEPGPQHRYLCFVLHGYGQLPQYFIQKFATLSQNDILFVAPEGLHRFYLNEDKKRVGASWMTKEDRLTDIADYVQMLDTVADEMRAIQNFERQSILGFSQGVATACRWIVHSCHSFHHLINWAGAFPPDLDYQKAHAELEDIPITLVAGDKDPYISEEKLEEHLNFLRSKKLSFDTVRFQGAHELEPETLEKVFRRGFSSID